MRVSSLGVARPAYYDRNAATGLANYAAGTVAPHVLTTRFTVTCAAGKKINLEYCRANTKRDAVATALATVYVVFTVTSGASTADVVYIMFNDNTLGFLQSQVVPSGVSLYAGETLTAQTLDNCTGGTISYALSSKYVSYDA